ncbi:hypothetical protein [Streptomyces sp. MH60]|uniref:hypothetical protein n=1 Tax=Streptomyces sp. MH60 TaxID=1940758 RepID=UPI000CEDE91F|nr:hypothetical protein [Streptomyces sp. MH60]PPS89600.1 hypothetical protein BZZ08_01747 [Streptomyces sp. MH60]
MTVTADTIPAPVRVEIVWTRRDGTRLTGLMNVITPADRAPSNDREPQWHITGGTRRATLDAVNDYDPADSHTVLRATPDQAARAAAAWLGHTDRPVHVTTVHEWRDNA